MTVEQLAQRAQRTAAALADRTTQVLSQVSTGNRTAVAFRMTGRHVGPLDTPLGQVPATGEILTIDVLDLLVVTDDRISEIFMTADVPGGARARGSRPPHRRPGLSRPTSAPRRVSAHRDHSRQMIAMSGTRVRRGVSVCEPERGKWRARPRGVQDSTHHDRLLDHHRQARRHRPADRVSQQTGPAPPTRRPFAPARGLFRVRASTRRDPHEPARVPRLRHDAARRRPAGGARPLGRGQAGHRRVTSTSSASGSSRAAGPGANPKDTEFFRRAPARADAAERRRSPRSARPGAPARRPPTTRRSARCSTPARRWSPWSRRATSGTSRRRCAPPSRRTSR